MEQDGGLAGVVLAAGEGRRLGGRPKALLRYHNEYLIDRLLKVLDESGCSSIVAVLGFEADAVLKAARLPGVRAVFNAEWATGMASSFRLGVAQIESARSDILVSVVDQPDISTELIARLREEHRPGRITVPTFSGRPGHPVLFDSALARMAAETAKGDSGARVFVRSHPELVVDVECGDLGSGRDIDTLDDFRSLSRC